MGRSQGQFELPGKIEAYLATLSRLYAKKNEARLQEVVVNGVVAIHEQWTYDNWNGGTYGHALTLTLPEDLFLEIVNDKGDLQTRICRDINSLNNVQNEHIDEVFIEMEPSEGGEWRESSGLLRPRIAAVCIPPQSLTRIWGTGHVRVFLSHKAEYKKPTSKLKECLGKYGIACFVAHEDIEPTEEWQREIEYALQSMDGMVALLTGDFHNSKWTDQEVGIALGRGVPVIAVCLEQDPYGFIGKRQGLQGCSWEEIGGMAGKIYALLHKRLPDQSRLFEAALAAYAESTSFADSGWKVGNVLSAFKTLTPVQVERIVRACRENAQNRDSYDGMRRLKPLLTGWTGREWMVHNKELRRADDTGAHADEIPF